MFVSPGLTIHRAGFLPFAKFPGDHRALWMDISMSDVIGYKPPPLSMASARRLTLQDPRVTKRYLSSLKTLLRESNALTKLNDLAQIPMAKWDDGHTQVYQQLSESFRSSMLQAERTCRKFKTGRHPWSPTLDKARRVKFYWELKVKHLLGLHVPMRKIIKLQKRLKITVQAVPLQTAMNNQSLARKEYSRIKHNSMKYRTSFREDLATAIASHKQISHSSAIRALINREETRDIHRRIKWMRRKYNGLSTSGVLISKSNGTKMLISDKETLERVIIAENERKFHQTEGQSPLLEGPLLQEIGLTATGPAVPYILNGTYNPPPGTSYTTKQFLKACAQPKQHINPIYDHLSYEHYCKAWSKAKEKTGSGIAHFGHWKAGILDNEISQGEWLLTTLPARYGFSPTVWQKATDVMILKKQGDLDLERLRTLVLYEADFNFLNKCLGRQVMDSAMVNGGMASEQYAKPGSSAQEQCITRRLLFDMVRYTRQALAMASSDLKSCYDRIVHNAASLAMQKNGVSKQAAHTMFSTIQLCQHYIRTAYGDSSKSYGGKGAYKLPPMGAGQGNGAGPQMWSVLSSVLFLAMHMEGLSTEFCQKMTNKFISIIGFMYVDDMDLIRLREEKDKHLLTEDLQLTLAYWNRLVKVTGGAIEPNKSGWYAFHQAWNHKMGNYEYRDIGSPGEVTARDKDGAQISLQYISCHTAQEMIGVKITPTGNQDAQIQTMMEKSLEESRLLREGNLSEVDTRHAVVTSFFPRLSWPLPCMSITHQVSKQLMRPVLNAALPKMGIVSTLGYDYIHGSSDFQGLGIPELYHTGYALQTEMLVDHIWQSTQTGHFLQMAIHEFILESGSTQHPLLPHDNTRLHDWMLTPNTWFAALRSYLIQHQIQINLHIPLLITKRQHDAAIMDILDGAPQFTSSNLKDINTCRIYKKVTFLSDIATGDGMRITKSAWTESQNTRQTEYLYNYQHRPNRRQWSAWRTAMTYLNQDNTNRLRHPLGTWHIDKAQYMDYWDSFFDVSRQQLLRKSKKGQWTLYSKISTGRTRQFSFTLQGTAIPPPPHTHDLHRTTVCHTPEGYNMEGYSGCTSLTNTHEATGNSPSVPLVLAIKSYCQTFSDSQWAIKHFETSPTIEHLIQDYINGKAIMVGDGSYNDITGYGAGASIVSSADGIEFIVAGGPTPGSPSTQSPYRSELGTIATMGILAHALDHVTGASSQIIVACDNDNALERPFLDKSRLSAKQTSADLITLAHDLWTTSSTTPIPTKVKGHADQLNRDLSLIEKLNCIVDLKAKEFLSKRPETTISRTGDPKYGLAHISFHKADITGKVSSTIQALQSLQRSKAAGIRNGQVTEDTWSKIDFRANSRASSQMSTYKKIFRTKWISSQLPVGTIMKQRQHRISDTCPTCLQPGENIEHLTNCLSQEAIQEYITHLENLSSWMRKVDTDPIILHHVIATLATLRQNTHTRPLPYPCILTKRKYYNIFKDQELIGWTQFSQGLLSTKWAILQHEYYTSIGSKRSGLVWASHLILQLWDINQKIWVYRNHQLHTNTTLLHQLHGTEYLDTAINREFCIGKGNLPTPFSPFFSQYTLQQLLSLSIDSKIGWFRTIRTAREDIGTDIHDAFTNIPALRSWIGLKSK